VLYGALALAMCLASIAFSVLFCIGRYCCCCCNRTNCCCIGLQCGGHEPTPRMCACGAIATESEAQETSPRSPGGAGVAVPGGILIGPGIRRASGGAEGGKVVKHAYPVAETVLVWLLLLVFVAFIIAMIGVGAAQGFLAIPTAAKEVAPTLTTAFMPTVNNVVTRVGALAVALGSQVLGPQLLEFNRVRPAGGQRGRRGGGAFCGRDPVPHPPPPPPPIPRLDFRHTCRPCRRGWTSTTWTRSWVAWWA
jgi:hypothetical protein